MIILKQEYKKEYKISYTEVDQNLKLIKEGEKEIVRACLSYEKK